MTLAEWEKVASDGLKTESGGHSEAIPGAAESFSCYSALTSRHSSMNICAAEQIILASEAFPNAVKAYPGAAWAVSLDADDFSSAAESISVAVEDFPGDSSIFP